MIKKWLFSTMRGHLPDSDQAGQRDKAVLFVNCRKYSDNLTYG